MEPFQLQLNIDNLSAKDLNQVQIQAQIDAACDSMGKVRRKMFAELGEVKKILALVQEENKALRESIRELKGEKIEWTYEKDGYLFGEKEPLRAIG